jgi:uncharacterized membrane protein YphA (DoxX/SURF4 family)
MNVILKLACEANRLLDKLSILDFLAPLAIRLYLAPVFFVAGMNKLTNFSSTADWFGNPDWGLGLPFPTLMAALATGTEVIGSVLLLLGLGVRWVSLPLMFTMLVAMFSVHWENGWQAIADGNSAFASQHLGPLQIEEATGAGERLERARAILQEHGNYEWLTETGSFVISNNGIEWAATYFVLLLALFFLGAGRFVSFDYWLHRKC